MRTIGRYFYIIKIIYSYPTFQLCLQSHHLVSSIIYRVLHWLKIYFVSHTYKYMICGCCVSNADIYDIFAHTYVFVNR